MKYPDGPTGPHLVTKKKSKVKKAVSKVMGIRPKVTKKIKKLMGFK